MGVVEALVDELQPSPSTCAIAASMSSVLKVMWCSPSPCFAEEAAQRSPRRAARAARPSRPPESAAAASARCRPRSRAHQVLTAERVAIDRQGGLDRVDRDRNVVELEAWPQRLDAGDAIHQPPGATAAAVGSRQSASGVPVVAVETSRRRTAVGEPRYGHPPPARLPRKPHEPLRIVVPLVVLPDAVLRDPRGGRMRSSRAVRSRRSTAGSSWRVDVRPAHGGAEGHVALAPVLVARGEHARARRAGAGVRVLRSRRQ